MWAETVWKGRDCQVSKKRNGSWTKSLPRTKMRARWQNMINCCETKYIYGLMTQLNLSFQVRTIDEAQDIRWHRDMFEGLIGQVRCSDRRRICMICGLFGQQEWIVRGSPTFVHQESCQYTSTLISHVITWIILLRELHKWCTQWVGEGVLQKADKYNESCVHSTLIREWVGQQIQESYRCHKWPVGGQICEAFASFPLFLRDDVSLATGLWCRRLEKWPCWPCWLAGGMCMPR